MQAEDDDMLREALAARCGDTWEFLARVAAYEEVAHTPESDGAPELNMSYRCSSFMIACAGRRYAIAEVHLDRPRLREYAGVDMGKPARSIRNSNVFAEGPRKASWLSHENLLPGA
jgi:hypothetical protein